MRGGDSEALWIVQRLKSASLEHRAEGYGLLRRIEVRLRERTARAARPEWWPSIAASEMGHKSSLYPAPRAAAL